LTGYTPQAAARIDEPASRVAVAVDVLELARGECSGPLPGSERANAGTLPLAFQPVAVPDGGEPASQVRRRTVAGRGVDASTVPLLYGQTHADPAIGSIAVRCRRRYVNDSAGQGQLVDGPPVDARRVRRRNEKRFVGAVSSDRTRAARRADKTS